MTIHPLFALVTGFGVFALAKKSATPPPAAANPATDPTTSVAAVMSGPDGSQSTAGNGAPVVAVAHTGAGLPKGLAAPSATMESVKSVPVTAAKSKTTGNRPLSEAFTVDTRRRGTPLNHDHKRGQGTARETQVAINGALCGMAPGLMF